MPKSVERCVKKLTPKKGKNSAWAICQASHKKRSKKRAKKR